MVSSILSYKCGPALAALTLGTLGSYVGFTFAVTKVRRLAPQDPGAWAAGTTGPWGLDRESVGQ